MQYPTVKRDNSTQRCRILLLIIGLCAVAVSQALFTVLYAIKGDGLSRAASPLSPDQLADANSDLVLTGLNAMGCSIANGGRSSSNNFWLLLLSLVSVRFLVCRITWFSR